MRVIRDECLPRRFRLELIGHVVSTVQQAGWAGISNGKLLALIAGNHDAFLTVDKNLPAQQRTAALPFGVIDAVDSVASEPRRVHRRVELFQLPDRDLRVNLRGFELPMPESLCRMNRLAFLTCPF